MVQPASARLKSRGPLRSSKREHGVRRRIHLPYLSVENDTAYNRVAGANHHHGCDWAECGGFRFRQQTAISEGGLVSRSSKLIAIGHRNLMGEWIVSQT